MKIVKLALIVLIGCVSGYSQNYKPPAQSSNLLTAIDFRKGKEIDKQYKKSFDDCDKVRGKNGCKSDPNRLETLLRFGDKAIFWDSKMALDLDGSYVGCNCGNNQGKNDQCATSYFWKAFPSDYDTTPKKDRCKFYQNQDFVDSNKIPYIVIPNKFGNHFKINNKSYGKEFVGDLGVVIYKGFSVPVIVADSGPYFRIGEGSAALFREIDEDRCLEYNGEQCNRFEQNKGINNKVLFFIFPNSKIGKDELNKDNALELIKIEALKRFEEFKTLF
jgi:Fungal chitosanase of glycosyl hydrolase group 75